MMVLLDRLRSLARIFICDISILEYEVRDFSETGVCSWSMGNLLLKWMLAWESGDENGRGFCGNEYCIPTPAGI